MLNQVILIGRLTKDPERRGQNSEKPVAVIRLAVDRDFKRDGDPDADFFNCSVFGNQAKFVLEYGKKGRLVSLVGRMQQREWTDQQTGEKHTVYEVSGSDIKFLDKKPENVGTPVAQNHAAVPASNMTPPAPVQPPMNERGRAVSDTGFLRCAGQLCVGAGRCADGQSAVLITKPKVPQSNTLCGTIFRGENYEIQIFYIETGRKRSASFRKEHRAANGHDFPPNKTGADDF